MGAYQKAAPFTFDTAAERIRDSLACLDGLGEPLDGWQSDMLARALAYLQMGNYGMATDAAFRVRRPELYGTKATMIAFENSPTVTVAEMRIELERVLAEKGQNEEAPR